MQLNLNIYRGREVEKVYTADEYDILFGTVEDLVNLIDVDSLTGGKTDADFVGAVAALLKGGIGSVRSLLKEIFPDVTDEELKRVKMRDVVNILVNVLKYGFINMKGASSAKNSAGGKTPLPFIVFFLILRFPSVRGFRHTPPRRLDVCRCGKCFYLSSA